MFTLRKTENRGFTQMNADGTDVFRPSAFICVYQRFPLFRGILSTPANCINSYQKIRSDPHKGQKVLPR